MTTSAQSIDRLVEVSEESIAKGSKSFALASRILPPETRRDVVMLYAWCRYADDVIDDQVAGFRAGDASSSSETERLKELESRTRNALSGSPDDDRVFQALSHIAKKDKFAKHHPLELIDGFRMDVEGRKYREFSDTLDYCYHVAGVVGVMMAGLMGARTDEALDRASDLGIAFQLTNIARDIFDDAEIGRVYLPSKWLEKFNLDIKNLADPANRKSVYQVALKLLSEADHYYASARAGYSALPFRARWSIAAAARIYREIGEVIRAGGPDVWRERVSTSTPRKLVLVLKALGDSVYYSRQSAGDERDGLYQRPRMAEN
ncbi:MAG: phytoene/squalene synthase family protein [Rhizobiaceae bacterium]